MGRRPKPTALHAIHGDPSHLRRAGLAARQAMETGPSGLPAPDDLSELQRTIWIEAVRNSPPGVLRRSDAGTLRVWTIAASLHRRACDDLAGAPLLVSASADPERATLMVQSPLLAIINRQATVMLRAAEALGFSPTRPPAPGRRIAAIGAAGRHTEGRPAKKDYQPGRLLKERAKAAKLLR